MHYNLAFFSKSFKMFVNFEMIEKRNEMDGMHCLAAGIR